MVDEATLSIAEMLFDNAVDASTLSQKYKKAWSRWKSFCIAKDFNIRCNPSVSQVQSFIVYMFATPSVKAWSGYSGTFNGVKHHLLKNNLNTEAWYDPKIKKILLGLKRQAEQTQAQKKFNKAGPATCTPTLLKQAEPHFRTVTLAQRNAQRCATVAAVAAFRLGELVATKHNKGKVPQFQHVSVKPFSIYSSESKTDRFKRGSTKQIPSNQEISAHDAIVQCIQDSHSKGELSKPFFCDDSGKAITAEHVMIELKFALQKLGIDTRRFTTKCFRRGGASDLKRKGGTDAQVRALGQWKTTQFKAYIDPQIVNTSPSANSNKNLKVIRTIHTRNSLKIILSSKTTKK